MASKPLRAPGDLAWSYVETFSAHVSVCEGPQVFVEQFASLPEYCRHLLATHYLTTEVCNGGFDQLFFNSTGVLAPDAVRGFRAIGMPQTADVVAEAIGLLGPAYPRDHELRQGALDALYPDEDDNDNEEDEDDDEASVFDALNDRFFELIEEENGGIEQASDAYAAKYPKPEPSRGRFDIAEWLRGIFGERPA